MCSGSSGLCSVPLTPPPRTTNPFHHQLVPVANWITLAPQLVLNGSIGSFRFLLPVALSSLLQFALKDWTGSNWFWNQLTKLASNLPPAAIEQLHCGCDFILHVLCRTVFWEQPCHLDLLSLSVRSCTLTQITEIFTTKKLSGNVLIKCHMIESLLRSKHCVAAGMFSVFCSIPLMSLIWIFNELSSVIKVLI